ncbi:MAG: hypothetical protein OEX97_14250 [Acidimicrobiia bacterium]|nr:hypothetical protein [Gemmatimonadota bacterium]MDH5374102.1 hypothetical protein [Acidimicrobiia bacterium]
MSLPIYSANRTEAGVEVYVTRNGFRAPLPHLLLHSPARFEWGFIGSGPMDLARSIVADYLGVADPDDAYTRAVAAHLIGRQPAEEWTLVPGDLHKAFRLTDPVHGKPIQLGRVVATRTVDYQLMSDPDGQTFVELCLIRHERGDWGNLDDHDTAANTAALRTGGRLLSNYPIPQHVCADGLKDDTHLWIITEAADDTGTRSHTTVLYPSNY